MYVQPHVQPHVRHEDNPIYKQEYTVELYIKSPVVVLGIISLTSNISQGNNQHPQVSPTKDQAR